VPDDEPPMTRVSVPEADREIGVRHPVLTHGFVTLVDYMGNDAAIVQAARVSYGRGTKSVRDDRGLIRYLMRHRHTTPFEMVDLKFLVRLPIFVARQWIRHRTACVAEGTRVHFDLPGGLRRRGNQLYSLSVEEIWDRFQPTRNRNPRFQRDPYLRRTRVQKMLVRQLDERGWLLDHSHIVGVSKNGLKPVFRMTLDDGKFIECTADHRFLFQDGWKTLAEATGLRESAGRAVWAAGAYQLYTNGAELEVPAPYHSKLWLEDVFLRQHRSPAEIAELCGVRPRTIRMWVRRHGLRPSPSPPVGFQPGNNYASLRPSRRGIPIPRRASGSYSRPYVDRDWLESRWVGLGLQVPSIAKECGVSTHTIRAWLRRHNLTDHPLHSPAFAPGHIPWNLGKTYRTGARTMTAAHLAIIRATRAGPASNFWKGGSSSQRQSIGRWTTQVAPEVHRRNHWTCQLCHRTAPVLHAHHIIPVWADESRARDPSNLATLCDACHREVHLDEQRYVEILGSSHPGRTWPEKPRGHQKGLTAPKLVQIRGFEYLGHRMTYDIEVDGPSHNFVANGIVTHNSVNEYSARYSVVPDEVEIPPVEEIRFQSQRNRQGREESVPPEVAERFRSDLVRVSGQAYEAYTRALEAGVARETARLLLPVAYYTQWYWKTNLWNLFHFLSLRLDPHAQEEIRLYAAELAKLAQLVCPIAFEAFEEFQLSGVDFSRREQIALRALLEGKSPEKACEVAGLPLIRPDGRPMTSGEGVEFLEKLEHLRSTEST